MHDSPYENHLENNRRFRDLYKEDFIKRMMFARDNGCNTVILTGEGEPLMNLKFLEDFGEWNNGMPKPFRWVELQTAGVNLDDEKLRFLRNTVGVNTISLSMSNMFDDDINAEINGTPDKLTVDIAGLCGEIKRYDFNLRLSLNMNSVYNNLTVEELFKKAEELNANQLTFRQLYTSGSEDLPQNKWINDHQYERFDELNDYIIAHGRELEMLPFGALRYSIHGMSVVLDKDCMATASKLSLKYLILRPNCKLYTKWDDPGALLF